MPPRIKTDRETIIQAAFEVAQSGGISAITAQSVSKALKTSVAPIFRQFQTIEDLRTATTEKINEFHTQFIKNFPPVESEFLTYGLAYIAFAKQYPYYFETIMQPGKISMNERSSKQLSFVVNSIDQTTGANDFEKSKDLFFNIWIYTHGIACLVYKGSISLTASEEVQLLSNAFKSFYHNNKS